MLVAISSIFEIKLHIEMNLISYMIQIQLITY